MSDNESPPAEYGDREIEPPDWIAGIGIDPASTPPAIFTRGFDIIENDRVMRQMINYIRQSPHGIEVMSMLGITVAEIKKPDYEREDGSIDLDAYHQSPEWGRRQAEMKRSVSAQRAIDKWEQDVRDGLVPVPRSADAMGDEGQDGEERFFNLLRHLVDEEEGDPE